MPRSSIEPVLRVGGLADEPGLLHGFSTLALGSMHGPSPDGRGLTPPRRAFAEAMGLRPETLTVVGSVHGTEIARVDRPAGVAARCDAAITDRPGLPLLATFADCYPVLLYDPARRALALVHAGWRGAAGGIARQAVEALTAEYGCRPADLLAGLGPGICGGCYEVGEEVAAHFEPAVVAPSPAGRFQLDLAAALRRQLTVAGVPDGSVHDQGTCTKENGELASHRRTPDGARCACLAAIG
jgi:YfiH family protein